MRLVTVLSSIHWTNTFDEATSICPTVGINILIIFCHLVISKCLACTIDKKVLVMCKVEFHKEEIFTGHAFGFLYRAKYK